MGERLRKLGSEKRKVFDNNFDELYDHYKILASDSGYHGTLKFLKEHGKVLIYVVLEEDVDIVE